MPHTRRRQVLAFMLGAIFGAPPAAAQNTTENTAAAPPLIVLDPGHTPKQPGTLSARGIREVDYNDRFVEELAPLLHAAGWRVEITRARGQHISLNERADFANRLGADLFLSIHHDSTQPAFVTATKYAGRPAQRTTEPFSGYSLYVSELNPRHGASYAFAHLLAQQIRPLGRAPALHHANPAKGENIPLYDAHLGIYRYDKLAVLRRTKIPAVLLEIGVIPDAADEAWVSTPANRHAMQHAITRAVRAWQRSRFYRAAP